MIKQNLFQLSVKVISESGVYENEHFAGKRSLFPGLYRRSQMSKPSEALSANIKESHQRDLPFDHDKKV